MSSDTIFDIQLVLGYIPWLFVFTAYYWPRLKAMDSIEAQRAIAILHAFRFFGLVFVLPGMVGAGLPAAFTEVAAYGDLATGVLAMLALSAIRLRVLFWPLVFAYNLVGIADLLVDYYHGAAFNIGAIAGQMGATYVIPIVYVPILMITHFAAFALMLRSASAKSLAGERALS